MEDDYEGNFETRSYFVYTLTFTAKTFLFGPLSDVSAILSERLLLVMLVPLVQVSEIQKETSHTELYQEPVQDYDDSYVTTVSEDIDETQKVFTVTSMHHNYQQQHTSKSVKKRCILRKSLVTN